MKQRRSLRTHERILDAAAREFATRGYAQSTMRTIADGIGMTKGALYGQFTSKEELAEELVRDGRSQVNALIRRTASQAGPLRALGLFVTELTHSAHTDMRMHAAFRLSVDQPDGVPSAALLLETVRDHLTDRVELAQREAELSAGQPPDFVAQLLLAAILVFRLWPAEVPVRPWTEFAWKCISESLAVPGPP